MGNLELAQRAFASEEVSKTDEGKVEEPRAVRRTGSRTQTV